MDIDEDIVESAQAHLAAAGFGQVQVVCGDGGFGYPNAAPYDRIILLVDDRNRVDAKAAYQLLSGPSRDWPTTVQLTPGEVWGGLNLWLALREPGFCWLIAEGEWVERGIVSYLFGHPGRFCSTAGLSGEASLLRVDASTGSTSACGTAR